MGDDIEYRVMEERDTDEVKELLYTSFFKEEPLGQSLRIDPSESAIYVDTMVEVAGKGGVSIVAVDGGCGDIIGCRLSIVETSDFHFEIPISKDNPKHDKIATIVKYLGFLRDGIDVFKKYDVDKCLHFQALNVKLEYAGRGIGKRLVEESIKLAKSKDIHLIVAEVSGKFSQRVYEKLGFDVMNEVKYDEYRDEHGVVIFSDTGIHKSGKLVAKLYD